MKTLLILMGTAITLTISYKLNAQLNPAINYYKNKQKSYVIYQTKLAIYKRQEEATEILRDEHRRLKALHKVYLSKSLDLANNDRFFKEVYEQEQKYNKARDEYNNLKEEINQIINSVAIKMPIY